jgi:hypothetical protein
VRTMKTLMLATAMLLSVTAAGPALAKDFREDRPPPPSLHCANDSIIWINTRTHVYHFPGMTWFGHTKEGRYACQHDADLQGDRSTKNGQ